MNNISKFEQETIVNFNAGEKTASIYTADPWIMKKLDKLCKTYPNSYKLVSQDSYSKTYEVESKKLIQFRSPRILTEEQKEVVRDRLNKNRS